MQIEPTVLPGVLLLTPRRYGDHRGFFAESYNRLRMAEAGIAIEFVQDNHSLSEAAGTIRGLHFQAPPHAQDKLVRCGRGAFLDVAVDIRRGSPTYGLWVAVELSFENAQQMLIPAGFAHGFLTLTPQTEIVYKCSDYYAPETEGAILWDDPGIGIDWRLSADAAPVVSARDAVASRLSAIDSPFIYEGPLPWEVAR